MSGNDEIDGEARGAIPALVCEEAGFPFAHERREKGAVLDEDGFG
jgi:hypothetical protein